MTCWLASWLGVCVCTCVGLCPGCFRRDHARHAYPPTHPHTHTPTHPHTPTGMPLPLMRSKRSWPDMHIAFNWLLSSTCVWGGRVFVCSCRYACGCGRSRVQILVCVCVCARARVHVWELCPRVHTGVCARVYVYAHASAYVCARACVCACVAYVCVRVARVAS